MSEAQLDRRCKVCVEAHGGIYLKLPATLYRGIPDRLVLLPGGRVLFVELKTPTGRGRLEKKQAWWAARLTALGFEYVRSSSFADVEAAVTRCCGGP